MVEVQGALRRKHSHRHLGLYDLGQQRAATPRGTSSVHLCFDQRQRGHSWCALVRVTESCEAQCRL